jgi:hypothetical protein
MSAFPPPFKNIPYVLATEPRLLPRPSYHDGELYEYIGRVDDGNGARQPG